MYIWIYYVNSVFLVSKKNNLASKIAAFFLTSGEHNGGLKTPRGSGLNVSRFKNKTGG